MLDQSLPRLIFSLHHFAVLFILCSCACATGAQAQKQLLEEAKTRAERFLFPLPQEVVLGPQQFSFPANACVLQVEGELSELEQQFIADFEARWEQKFGADLKSSAGSEPRLTIVVGKRGDSTLDQAARAGHLDLEKLASRPNAEQAYAITCTEDDNGATVFLAFNDSAGLYYALGTLEQLAESLSTPETVSLPQATILDWPDIPMRGIWGSTSHTSGKAMSDELARYSALKLNFWERNRLRPRLREDGTFHCHSMAALQAEAVRRNVVVHPYLSHLEQMLHADWAADLYKLTDQITTDENKSKSNSWCWYKPESLNVLTRLLMGVAETEGVEEVSVRLSETRASCHCSQCKGDSPAYFVNESKNLVEAYRKVKQKHPQFRMNVLTTQGSYPSNDAIFNLIPPEVPIQLYGGSGPGNTYHTEYRPILDGYPVDALRKKGHTLGALPMLTAAHAVGTGAIPFNTPSLAKSRMAEHREKKITRAIAWLPYTLEKNDVNLQAEAEFAWNLQGRNVEQFATAWATRKGYAEPEAVAQIITLLDRPARMLSIGMGGDKFTRCLVRMTDRLAGVEPQWGPPHDLLRGLDRENKSSEAKQLVQRCDQALALAEQSSDQAMIASARLLKCWSEIMYEYAIFDEQEGNPATASSAKANVARLANGLPQLWLDWHRSRPLARQDRRQRFSSRMEAVASEFARLGPMPDVASLTKDWVAQN